MRNFVTYLVMLIVLLSCSKEDSPVMPDNPVNGNLTS